MTFFEVLNACANVGANERPCVPTKSTSLNAIMSKINMWEVALGIWGQV
jgi:hypothetical protein